MKTIIFTALIFGLLSFTSIRAPAEAAGTTLCPSFNAAMVDAAALASLLFESEVTDANDDKEGSVILCEIETKFGFFQVEVNVAPGIAVVSGSGEPSTGDVTVLQAYPE